MTVWLNRACRLAFAALLIAGLAACGDPSKTELVEKARGIETKTALRQALGPPDDIAKLGPVEKWTYQASDGTVVFVITGETVIVDAVN